ncbi:MAG: glycosyl transferase [Chloroflexi bacterium]|nr:glycosyl transferase [Chloroflexota bacterium]
MPISTVSAVVLVRNEAQDLDDCLRSLSWADERLVIDSFSVDGSARIDDPDVRVVERRFTNFSDQREAALRLAAHDWVFFVDADERVSVQLSDEIVRRVGAEEFFGYWVPRRNRILGHWMRATGWSPDFQLRLMDRRHAGYDRDRPVHELAKIDGRVGYLECELLHLSYEDVRGFRRQQRLYAELVADGMIRSGVRRRFTAMFFQPVREFWRRMFTLRGYRDGQVGFLLAILMAEHEWHVQRIFRRRRFRECLPSSDE